MAKLFVCSVYDSKAEAFMRPMFVPAKGVAIRAFLDEANRESHDNLFYKYPDDYTLYLVSEFDEASGVFENVSPPELLMQGSVAKQVK